MRLNILGGQFWKDERKSGTLCLFVRRLFDRVAGTPFKRKQRAVAGDFREIT